MILKLNERLNEIETDLFEKSKELEEFKLINKDLLNKLTNSQVILYFI